VNDDSGGSITYRVLFESRAEKHLARIDPVIRRRIAKAIDALCTDPEPAGCNPLKGMPGVMRLRVGDYRIVYVVARDQQVIDVIDIDHRKDIYRN
jgi:mRNA interferase RelE/StbE